MWYFIRIIASWAYRPVPLPEHPTYIASEDVTIIVPTIDAGEEFREAAHSWLVGNPKEILIITEEKMRGPLQELADSVDPERIRVLTVPYANKRLQMAHGIKNTTTDIIVFADDDAIYEASRSQVQATTGDRPRDLEYVVLYDTSSSSSSSEDD